MTCEHCLTALSRPHHGLYQSWCQGCQMRLMARSIAYWDSQREKRITPAYQAQLERLFGEEWREGHERVKALAQRLRGEAA